MSTIVRNLKDGTFDAEDQEHVYIGRANRYYGLEESKWCNPFVMERESQRADVIEEYRRYLHERPDLLKAIPELKGKVLFCWCHPKACHGDVLAELTNEVPA